MNLNSFLGLGQHIYSVFGNLFVTACKNGNFHRRYRWLVTIVVITMHLSFAM